MRNDLTWAFALMQHVPSNWSTVKTPLGKSLGKVLDRICRLWARSYACDQELTQLAVKSSALP